MGLNSPHPILSYESTRSLTTLSQRERDWGDWHLISNPLSPWERAIKKDVVIKDKVG
jgi:hypothetical protein